MSGFMKENKQIVNKLSTGLLLLVVLSLGISISCTKESEEAIIEQKVEALLAKMTLDEKIGQMTQIRHFDEFSPEDIKSGSVGSIIHTDGPTPGNTAEEWQARFIELQKQALDSRLGIPLLFGVDAIHGQNTFEGATIFPHNIGLGATQNTELVEEAAAITALEMQGTGFNWTFSPCISIPYNEKWGRVYEAFSESTELTREFTKASVKGHQGNLSDKTTVMATAKHYVGDGSTEYGKEGGNTTLSIQEVSKRLLPPYRDAVNAGIGAIMVGFNDLSGISMHAHKPLITDTLKKGMKFDGIVVTDWKGYSRFGKNDVINAGVDMVMAVDGDMDGFQKGLKAGVENGSVPMTRIDDAVRRILRQKFRLGLFDHPFPDTTLTEKIGAEKHRAKARQAVRESMVLLKNNDKTLPIPADAEKIVVVGEHADNTGLQSGGWTIRWQGVSRNYEGATSILTGIKEMAEGKVAYDTTGTGVHADADWAIIVVGEKPYAEFFGDIGDERGTCSFTLTEKHKAYIEAYNKKDIKTVIVLISGRPLVVTEEIAESDAFVAAWLPGSEGDGVAQVLFGAYNFTGKLPHSWPVSVEDFNGKYGPNFWNEKVNPLYEIGFGLSYQDFQKNDN
ncbi:glycoside hydrolase family 3 protein [Salinivirga sp.]|uniref:glycoside hydrolase family 3 protein n=1 Tax=Salinivirga sp. TaxID=1970192 RepID=UPI002B458E2B|nr:glycoside hydrolase family 3 N-terminal domain-containing protein [Salinivirga sp.]